jgi:hypothetical protein
VKHEDWRFRQQQPFDKERNHKGNFRENGEINMTEYLSIISFAVSKIAEGPFIRLIQISQYS